MSHLIILARFRKAKKLSIARGMRFICNGSFCPAVANSSRLWANYLLVMPTLTFQTPDQAAKAVYVQNSVYTLWDQLEKHIAPAGLSGWEKVEDNNN